MIKDLQKYLGTTVDGVIGKKTIELVADKFNLANNAQAAHFMAQCHHESMGFTRTVENLNYRAEALAKIYPKYIKPYEARFYAQQPEKIANKIYANRMGNGDESTGDGWRYRGRGYIQITGKNNYYQYFKNIGLSIISPDLLLLPPHALASADWFFYKNDIYSLCKNTTAISVLDVSRAVNLGNIHSNATPNGFLDRVALTKQYFDVLKGELAHI